jgi:hypothetical protein
MSEDRHIEPHVSGNELRAALATAGRSRPNPVMSAWEWTTDEQAELDRLRASMEALEAEVAHLRGVALDARGREHALRDALHRLSGAKLWERRGVRRELGAQGLL